MTCKIIAFVWFREAEVGIIGAMGYIGVTPGGHGYGKC
jgi:hypothetical protein